MKRKEFLRTAAAGAVATGTSGTSSISNLEPEKRMHLVTLSFDDGFLKSFTRIAEIFEKHSLSACLNIVAGDSGGPDSPFRDAYVVRHARGDFALWNELQDRGHEVMPHGYRHARLPDLPLREALDLITRCLDIFGERLRGFDPMKAVFNFPYNDSTPEIEEWLSTRVMAFRTGYATFNPLPTRRTTRILTSGHGPENCEKHLDRRIAELLAGPSRWFVYNLHGLDDEGWGPIRASYLDRLLGRLTEEETVRVVPAARAILQAG